MATSSSQPPGQGARPNGAPPRTAPERNGTLPREPTPDKANGRAAVDPAAGAKPGSAERQTWICLASVGEVSTGLRTRSCASPELA